MTGNISGGNQPIQYDQKDKNTRIYHTKKGDVNVTLSSGGIWGDVSLDKTNNLIFNNFSSANVDFSPGNKSIGGQYANFENCNGLKVLGTKNDDVFATFKCTKTIIDGGGGNDYLAVHDNSIFYTNRNDVKFKNIKDVDLPSGRLLNEITDRFI